MHNDRLRRAVTAAMLIAVGLFLPFLTAGIPEIGKMLLPMHLPVLLCGFVCGWQYGLLCGVATPLLRSLLFGAPVLYPSAVSMAFELAAYGVAAALFLPLFYRVCGKRLLPALYTALVCAMLTGRVVMGVANTLLYAAMTKTYTASLFFAAAFTTALPGIALQLVLVPAVALALHRAGLFTFPRKP